MFLVVLFGLFVFAFVWFLQSPFGTVWLFDFGCLLLVRRLVSFLGSASVVLRYFVFGLGLDDGIIVEASITLFGGILLPLYLRYCAFALYGDYSSKAVGVQISLFFTRF